MKLGQILQGGLGYEYWVLALVGRSNGIRLEGAWASGQNDLIFSKVAFCDFLYLTVEPCIAFVSTTYK